MLRPMPQTERTQVQSSAKDGPPPLTLPMLLAYSMPMIPVHFSFVLFVSYVNKYAIDVLLIAPAAMGLIFGASRLWDAITDPITGLWSDRTQHAWGRRRPWVAASAIPMAVSGWMVWSPPAGLEGGTLIAWTTFAVFAFTLSVTIFYTPHQALGAELTTDTHAVSRIFAFRQAAIYVGMFGCLVVGMPALMTASDRKGLATTFALVCGAAIIVTVLLSAALLREPGGNRRKGGAPTWAWRETSGRTAIRAACSR